MASAKNDSSSFTNNPQLIFCEPALYNKADAQLLCFVLNESNADYHEKKCCANMKPFTQSIPKENWKQLQAIACSPVSTATGHMLHKFLPTQTHRRTATSVPNAIVWDYYAHRPLEACEVLRLQLTGNFKTSSQTISPAAQLLEVCPNLQVCIEHNSSPSECFSDTSLGEGPTSYANLEAYSKQFNHCILAEAAVQSVTDSQLLIITDVTLIWPVLQEIQDSQGQLSYRINAFNGKSCPEDFCACVQLPTGFAAGSDFFRITEGDLMCIRSRDTKGDLRGVFHMVVHSVDGEDDGGELGGAQTVYLKFVGKRSNFISEALGPNINKFLSEIQLIPISIPLRRIYKSHKFFCSHNTNSLAHKIALFQVLVPDYNMSHKARGVKSSIKFAGKQRKDNSSQNRPPFHYWKKEKYVNRQTQLMNPKDKEIHQIISKEQAKIATSLWTNDERTIPLNEYQKAAVKLSLNHKFVMIQGPPGTGKSVTGAHIAYALAMKLRKELASGELKRVPKQPVPCVMYCGPSQQSVNVVLDILISSAQVQASGLKIVRVYSSAIQVKDFHGPKFNPLLFKQTIADGICEEKFKKYALHHIIREKNPRITELDREFSELKEKKIIPSIPKRKKYASLIMETSIAVLQDNVDIILCTCNEAGSFRIGKSVVPTYCIIDECGMATEPECMVPIRKASHVVLIGDHKQLQPVIQSREAGRMGMATSLFERYCNAGYRPHLLQIQYRMHDGICVFPSEEIYDGEVFTDPSVKEKYRDKLEQLRDFFWPAGIDLPVVVCDVVGREEENHTGQRGSTRVGLESKRNVTEAEKIVEIAEELVMEYGVDAGEVAVITPYSAQKEEIRNKLKEKDLSEVLVKTITESQGSEYGIVLLSTVRSLPLNEVLRKDGKPISTDVGWRGRHLGFITDRHQICVGITRCKYGMVIIGNIELLCHDGTWNSLIQHYETNNCLVRGEEFP